MRRVHQEVASTALRDSNVPHINGAFVAEKQRGTDIGQALLANIFQWAKQENATRVTVDFESTNLEGAGFWMSRGFEPLEFGMIRRLRG